MFLFEIQNCKFPTTAMENQLDDFQKYVWFGYQKTKTEPGFPYISIVNNVCVKGARHAFAESAGRNMANPTAILLCASNMLSHIGLYQHAETIRSAVKTTIRARKVSSL